MGVAHLRASDPIHPRDFRGLQSRRLEGSNRMRGLCSLSLSIRYAEEGCWFLVVDFGNGDGLVDGEGKK